MMLTDQGYLDRLSERMGKGKLGPAVSVDVNRSNLEDERH